MSAGSAAARVFFAAWPVPELQDVLGNLAREFKPICGGRTIATRNIHLTLAFLGDVARDRLPRIEALASSVTARRFDLIVDRVEYWRHNRIVWAGVAQCPDAILGLVAQLEAGLSPEGFRFERRPYVPHVTLLRDARRAPAASAVPPLSWAVDRYALVESAPRGGGREYVVLREWPLAAGGG